MQEALSANPWQAGDTAVFLRRYQLALFLSGVQAQVQRTGNRSDPRPTVSPPILATVAPESSPIDWTCVAIAETGGDYSMHGSSYSSAYGVMNEAVRENSPPDVAARILAGTASQPEQLAMAESIANRFGIDAWAPSTAARCG